MSRRVTNRDTRNRHSHRLELIRQASPSNREEREQPVQPEEEIEEDNNVDLPEEEDR